MIRTDQMPDEVVKAALSAYKYASSDVYTTEEHDMAEALVAALNAWPMVTSAHSNDWILVMRSALILPLPQEKQND
jgi:hypothetical protein